MLAYYEKHNKKAGLELIKKLKKEEILTKYKKIYNLIEQKLASHDDRTKTQVGEMICLARVKGKIMSKTVG